jgi:hypothetical protein
MNPHFASLVMSLAAQANSLLDGQLPPGVPAEGINPREVARSLIDTLVMLEEKTAGGLDPDEARLLTEALTALRIRFVKAAP